MTVSRYLRELCKRGRGRSVSLARCPVCDAPILTGLDADLAAFVARVDPEPVTPLGEALGLLANRPSYELTRHTSGLKLTYRNARAITARPADGPGFDVVIGHACNSPPLPKTPTIHKPPTASEMEKENGCPF